MTPEFSVCANPGCYRDGTHMKKVRRLDHRSSPATSLNHWDWMSIDELAWRLNVTRNYALRLLRAHAIRPVRIVRGSRYVLRVSAQAYRRKQRARARTALRELGRVSQDVHLYENTTSGTEDSRDPPVPVEVDQNRMSFVISGQLVGFKALRAAQLAACDELTTAIRHGSVFSVTVEGRQYYPAFFVSSGVSLRVFEKIAHALGPMDAWTKWDFFTSRRGSLGDRSPLELLTRGETKRVMEFVERFRNELLS
jgi:excisionase family DNA binding protein